jgi:hypothetical protein
LPTGDPSHRQKQALAEGERLKKIYQANGHSKWAGRATVLSDKVDLKLILIKQDKERHTKLIKGEIH